MTALRLGPLLHSFFVEHLTGQKGLRPSSVRSYRDAVRLLLVFVASDKRCKLSGIELDDLTFDRVQRFLRHLEEGRGNGVPTRNQRLAALHTFTFAHAVHMGLRRVLCDKTDQTTTLVASELLRGVFDAAMSLYLDRFLNILPTVTIREGTRVKVYLSNDLLLPEYSAHNMPSNL